MQVKFRHLFGQASRLWILALVLVAMAPVSHTHADTGADRHLWEKANAFYTARQYDSAAVYYGTLLKQYPDNAALQYNMGNVSYRLNRTGPAILYFEKALHLDPGNKEVEDNLILARSMVQQPIPEASPIFFVSWWHKLLHAVGSDVWAMLCLLVFIALLVLVYFARVRKERFAHAGRWLSLGIVSLLICACMAYFSYDAEKHSGKAVVMQDASVLRESPAPGGKALLNLPEGTVVEIYGELGAFISVKLPNGREGWVAISAISKV